MNTLGYRLFIVGTLFSAINVSHAISPTERQLKGAKPSMLILEAKTAVVAGKSDQQTITLQNVHPLVAVTHSLGENRFFTAFSISAFSESWNSCNRMKDQLQLWNKDGYSSYFVYTSGPLNGEKAKYLTTSPLYTSPDAANPKYAMGKAGALPLFLDRAKYDATHNTETFLVKNGAPKNGVYQQITLLTECILPYQ